jgi:hypothetical protein
MLAALKQLVAARLSRGLDDGLRRRVPAIMLAFIVATLLVPLLRKVAAP